MPASIVYLDESGDLGWSLDAPYRHGGSSRYLTVAALCVPREKRHLPKRVIKQLYEDFKWDTGKEKKWVDMPNAARESFAKAAARMCVDHPDIHLHALVVKKERVEDHIRKDPNKLYNYMIRLCVLDCMATFQEVTLIPDPRSIKVESGNSLHDYLQTELWFTLKVKTVLSTQPMDSATCRGIQFSDMLAGLIQTRFEDRFFDHIKICIRNLKLKRLFFA